MSAEKDRPAHPTASRQSRLRNVRRACGSRPAVGSSSTSRAGRLTSARARNRRCRCPPESVAKGTSALSSRSKRARSSSPAKGSRVERAEEIQGLARSNLVLQGGCLELSAHEPFRLGRMRPQVQTVDLNRAGIGLPQSEDTFEGGGLARRRWLPAARRSGPRPPRN